MILICLESKLSAESFEQDLLASTSTDFLPRVLRLPSRSVSCPNLRAHSV
jgi:hypothetical protein